MAENLPQLGDLSSYIDRDTPTTIKNTAIIAVGSHIIQVSGVILAARSSIFKDMLEKDNEIYLTEFVDVVDGVYTCLKLLYGGSVVITPDNVKVIFKFGVLYKIKEMEEMALAWLRDELTLGTFWDIFVRFQSYHVTTLDTFGMCVARLVGEEKVHFLKETETVLDMCTETRQSKDMVNFIFSHICSDNLGDIVPILCRVLKNPNCATKETCAEALLAGLEGVFTDNPDSVSTTNWECIVDVLECLEDILEDNISVTKRISLLRRSLLSIKIKQEESSEAAGPSNTGITTLKLDGTQKEHAPTSWLDNQVYINSLTETDVSVDSLVIFVEDTSVPPFVALEIVAGCIWKNKSTAAAKGLVLLTAPHIAQLPKSFYRLFVRDRIAVDFLDQLNSTQYVHDKRYAGFWWDITAWNSMENLFDNESVSLSIGTRTATFRHKPGCVPAYDLTENNLYEDGRVIGEISHWCMSYMHFSNANWYTFSFITNVDENGNDMDEIRKIKPTVIRLHCLCKKLHKK